MIQKEKEKSKRFMQESGFQFGSYSCKCIVCCSEFNLNQTLLTFNQLILY